MKPSWKPLLSHAGFAHCQTTAPSSSSCSPSLGTAGGQLEVSCDPPGLSPSMAASGAHPFLGTGYLFGSLSLVSPCWRQDPHAFWFPASTAISHLSPSSPGATGKDGPAHDLLGKPRPGELTWPTQGHIGPGESESLDSPNQVLCVMVWDLALPFSL